MRSRAKGIGQEVSIEELGLSVRARNALHASGCQTVGDTLRLDLNRNVRGLGRKTRDEIFSALERAGFRHPALEGEPLSEIRSLERSLARFQGRVNSALGAVAKEIHLLKERLRKEEAGANGHSGYNTKIPHGRT